MPELPEVETVYRGLRPIVGRRIVAFSARQPKALNLPLEVMCQRALQPITDLRRQGKSLALWLESDQLWLHLGLSGQASLDLPGSPRPEKAPMIQLDLDDGSRLRLDRLFMGYAHLYTYDEASKQQKKLGRDALEVNTAHLAAIAGRKPALGIKAALMDQSLISGVGNIYSDEALHLAKLHPARKLGSLSAAELGVLADALARTLQEAIENGGEEGYFDLGGQNGRFHPKIHGVESCPSCGATLTRGSFGGRGCFFCGACQI